MIKFRYKRKETTTNNGVSNSGSNTLTKNNNNKSVEIKSNDDDKKQNSLKCETTDSKSTPQQMIKTKTSIEQEYMEDCIRSIVVSV